MADQDAAGEDTTAMPTRPADPVELAWSAEDPEPAPERSPPPSKGEVAVASLNLAGAIAKLMFFLAIVAIAVYACSSSGDKSADSPALGTTTAPPYDGT